MGRGDTALAVACLGGDERYEMVELLSNDQYGRGTINMVSDVRDHTHARTHTKHGLTHLCWWLHYPE